MFKKIKLGMAFLLIVAMLIPNFIYGNEDLQKSEIVNVEVYDKLKAKYESEEVPMVNLMFGKDDILTTDVPAFIMDGRTLVPIYFIAETLGANVKWKQDTMQAIINKDGKEIILTIDSKDAIVNGKVVPLPNGVPAKLVTYEGSARTVVPFRFVSEQLGMDIKWFEGTYTAVIDYPQTSIKSVQYTTYNGIPAIAIKADSKVNYNSMYLPAVKLGTLDSVIIDIPNADIGKNNFFKESVGQNGIIGYRAAVINADNRDTTRVTVELEVGGSHKTYYDAATNIIYVTFVNEISKVEFQENSEAVVIKTDKSPTYNVIDLGDRVAIDILDAKIEDIGGTINIGNDVVSQVRYSQYDKDYKEYSKVVRVVFDLKKGVSLEDNMYIDTLNDDIIVYMTTDPMNQFKYEYVTAMVESQVVLDLNGISNYTVTHDTVNKLATVRVKKSDISLINEMRLDLFDGIVNYIEIDGEKDSLYYNINVKYNSETTAKVTTGNLKGSSIVLGFSNIKSKPQDSSPYKDILIVLDPGHGGKDPGASAGGVAEKSLNLDTAIKLKELLEEAGFKVEMTRDKDIYIGLYERADFANALNADLFLSIHHNASSNTSSNGVLTVFDGTVIASKTTFATTMQNAMYKGLGAKNMGLQNRSAIVVTRETKMPSALAEMGFMTNPYELSLLSQGYYRQKCAQALFDGIKNYVDTKM